MILLLCHDLNGSQSVARYEGNYRSG